MSSPGPDAALSRKVLVWDLPTRIFHWLVAALVLAAYVTERMNWMDWHAWSGDAVLALLLFRLLWGVFGSETARFSSFLASPRAAAHHLAAAFRREPDRQVGHNPAGAWMVVLLLALLFGETVTGIYVDNDVADHGPLTPLVPAPVANLITDLHQYFWYVLLAAVCLHLAAILVYAAAKRHNLVTPMITGTKLLPTSVKQPRIEGVMRAALLFGCGALAAAALANFL
ncbi:MAG TPA: cytochrome b/b6 domain-containing protein [Stellaceae bacterium]|nr:cytochrome b/b6 domain-containing protein [Stellaceae bacterium]